LVVVGGDAAGMSAASQAKRLRGDDLEVVAFERTSHTSYSACGIPYWIAGDVEGGSGALVARSVEEHRRNGIDLRMGTCVEALDIGRGTVTARDLDSGTTTELAYDHLVIATGATPVRPRLPGIDGNGVFGVQTLDDGERVAEWLGGRDAARAVVVGAGYIGVEMAEAMLRRGLEVTVVEKMPQPLGALDPDMGALAREAMECEGIGLATGVEVRGVELDGAGAVTAVETSAGRMAADIVVLGLGVRPETALADAAGLPLGASRGLLTDLRMRVRGHDNVWAAGDCVEVFDRVARKDVHIPLGTHANKQGRAIGTNIGGGYATFPGVVGTAVTKVCGVEVARTGLREADARAAGFDALTVKVESTTRAGYFPGAQPLTVKMIAERRTGRLLGVQILGREGAAKRIDVCAVALWNDMTVEAMSGLDLGYAPPYSPVWDPVLIAARKAADAVAAPRHVSGRRDDRGRMSAEFEAAEDARRG
jgi:NADPH-dependent 2,4-dienoyl-CoA reductase/sulfur reductase-like enzyme